MRLAKFVAIALAAWSWALACSGAERPPFAGSVRAEREPAEAGVAGGLQLGDAAVGPTGPCGDQRLPVVENPPNLNFVIDHSASMGDPLDGTTLSKYENARIALSRVLRAVGHRVNYGAAVFPGLSDVTGCEAGEQLVQVGLGDPPSFAREGKNGKKLADLLERLQIAGVKGGTPVSATLVALQAEMSRLVGTTYVVLVTDGAPNCNQEGQCDADACIPNIEGLANCTALVNCCTPSPEDPKANLGCVDDQASVDAVLALAAAGISTYVVGMPGSEAYASVLDSMAVAGGTARAGALKYYAVSDTDALEAALRGIAASLAISCEIPLDYVPDDRSFVNVYFDDMLVQYDPKDGWEWTPDGGLSIRGEACDRLGSGDVLEVQILAGCPTEVK